MVEIHKIASFFSGWNETLIWSCLQGCMGYAIADDDANPSAAQIVVGDFCFFAGIPNNRLVEQAAAPILIPHDQGWSNSIEFIWGNRVESSLRYAMNFPRCKSRGIQRIPLNFRRKAATRSKLRGIKPGKFIIKKNPNVFRIEKLTKYAVSLEKAYELRLFDKDIYHYVMRQNWSKDLCSQFLDYMEYHKRGIGVAVIYKGEPISGASSCTVYNGGIEIEIDTKPEFRNKGLATACGAKLILECLHRGLYPSWDAHDLRSVALAEKLGYPLDFPYTVYIKR